jgi:Delta7-sterol 5-desaturase
VAARAGAAHTGKPVRTLLLLVPHRVGLADALKAGAINAVVIVLALLAIHVLFRRFFRVRRIQPGSFSAAILGHELAYSTSTLLISGSIGVLIVYLQQRGVVQISGGASLLVIGGQIVLYLLTFDLYFYLVHRLLHHRAVYPRLHRIHHVSTAPNPLTAFSIHPIEAMINGAVLPLFLLVVPMDFYAVAFVGLHAPVNSILLHNGHEVFPRWWYRTPLARLYATPLFHDFHHSHVSCNYGVLTTVWDRVFGTMKPHFTEDFARFHSARRALPPESEPTLARA